MRILSVANVLALLSWPAWAQSLSTAQHARELRQKAPGPAAYASYRKSMPDSLAEFQELFATKKYTVLLEQGMSEGSTGLAFVPACNAYETVGVERYVRKFLEMAAEAGSWGGPLNRDREDRSLAGP